MRYRLHFTDQAMAQRDQLGLDQDAVVTAIDAGTKLQVEENRTVARHRGLEVEVQVAGPDYTVVRIAREAPWPVAKTSLAYVTNAGQA